MTTRPKRPCSYPGCSQLVATGYCDKHKQQSSEHRRGSAAQRGYTSKWAKYSKWFLKQPGNHICKLRLPGCDYVARCVDHIQPPKDKDDPLFWLKSNHQSSCIHCNSVKGRKTMKGEG